MRTLFVIESHPFVNISLQLIQILIDFLAKSNLVELFADGFVKPFADAVRLWMLDLRLCMIDIFDRQVKLIFVMLSRAAILRAAIG
jgi:hypothetical protein